MRPGNTALFEEMLQRWRAVGNTVSDLTGPSFEPLTSRSRDERVTARLAIMRKLISCEFDIYLIPQANAIPLCKQNNKSTLKEDVFY